MKLGKSLTGGSASLLKHYINIHHTTISILYNKSQYNKYSHLQLIKTALQATVFVLYPSTHHYISIHKSVFSTKKSSLGNCFRSSTSISICKSTRIAMYIEGSGAALFVSKYEIKTYKRNISTYLPLYSSISNS